MGLSPDDQPAASTSIPLEAALQQVSQIMQQAQTKGSRQQTLVQALLPYLNPKRQERLERAMQLSQLSRIAGSALQGNIPFPLYAGGDHNV